MDYDISKVIFLDIETVPEEADFSKLSEKRQSLWVEKVKSKKWDEEDMPPNERYTSAGIYAEFGKIICISMGYFSKYHESEREFRVTSIIGEEINILNKFTSIIDKEYFKNHLLCAHNGKEFDFPFIARRCIINNVKIPNKLNIGGKKPWEVQLLDTMELWRFGDWKAYTSIDLLAEVLNVPSPKDEMRGDLVRDTYYEYNNIKKIADYCVQDTITVAQLLLRYNNLKILKEKEIIVANNSI